MRFKIDELPERYQEQARAQIAGEGDNPRAGPVVEPDTGHVIAGKDEAKEAIPPARVSLRVIHYRRNLVDFDNLFIKYFLDSIVDAGILRDDSPKEIESITHEQIKTKGEEKVIFEIYQADLAAMEGVCSPQT